MFFKLSSRIDLRAENFAFIGVARCNQILQPFCARKHALHADSSKLGMPFLFRLNLAQVSGLIVMAQIWLHRSYMMNGAFKF
jgi:hypothetical protein